MWSSGRTSFQSFPLLPIIRTTAISYIQQPDDIMARTIVHRGRHWSWEREEASEGARERGRG
jgi:hypothetical protein